MRAQELASRDVVKTRAVLSEQHEGRMGFFAVGMVMKHKRYDYECVIYGWDAVCTQSQVGLKLTVGETDIVDPKCTEDNKIIF